MGGALEAVVAAMQRHSADPFVMEQALACCAALTAQPGPRRAAMRMGVTALVAGALRAHAGSPRAVAAACGAAMVLAMAPGAAAKPEHGGMDPFAFEEEAHKVSEELKLLLLSEGTLTAICAALEQLSAAADSQASTAAAAASGAGKTDADGGAQADTGGESPAATATSSAFRPSKEDRRLGQFRCGKVELCASSFTSVMFLAMPRRLPLIHLRTRTRD